MSRVFRHVMTGLVSILLDAMLLRSGSRVLLLLLTAPPACSLSPIRKRRKEEMETASCRSRLPASYADRRALPRPC